MDETLGAFMSAAVGYILKAASESKIAETVTENVLGRFWSWVKDFFISDVPELEEKPDDKETDLMIQKKLLVLIKDESFLKELTDHVKRLQDAGIKKKNIVEGDIARVKRIRIGDREISADDRYEWKNIVTGNVSDADEFTLGDGH